MDSYEKLILPENWAWMPVKEIIEKIPLTNKKLKQKEYQQNGKFPVIDQGQVFIGGYTDKEELKISYESPLIVFGDHTKIVKFVNFDFVAGADGVKVIRPKKVFYPRLFYYFIQGIPLPDKGYARHFQFLEKSFIPLPPLPEQHRIVERIEQLFTNLDAGVESLKAARAQLKRYRQSVLKSACEGRLVPNEAELARAEGREYEPAEVLLERILEERRRKWEEKNKGKKYKDPIAPETDKLNELPEGWHWGGLDEISQHIVDCLHSTPKFVNEGKYCIDTNCIEQGKIIFENARFVSVDTYNERVRRLVPKAGDILFAREGTIGTAVIVPPNFDICLGQRMMMFRTENGIDSSYFMLALQSKIFELQWKLKITGSTVPHINIGEIKMMAIPLPPLTEQHRIVTEVERCLLAADEMEKTIEHSLKQAERLRQSILKRAFEGKLIPQDPEDEPAGVLLERIKGEKAKREAEEKAKNKKR
ncbi:MAG: restriction endonuclease subunit S [Methanosarcinales archaeon]|nr:restriction endonuclease subunit S [Methanosarcinales archaeon]